MLYMTDEYKRAMHAAIQELSDLMEERENLDTRRERITRRIAVLRDGIFGLSGIAGENPYTVRPELFPNTIPPDTGITDAVREVLKSRGLFVSTLDIKEMLEAMGFNITKYKNPLSTIHQVLNRLIDSGEVESHEDDEKRLYRWKKLPTVKRGIGGDPPPIDGPFGEGLSGLFAQPRAKTLREIAIELAKQNRKAQEEIAQYERPDRDASTRMLTPPAVPEHLRKKKKEGE
jgi:hypothetical protein